MASSSSIACFICLGALGASTLSKPCFGQDLKKPDQSKAVADEMSALIKVLKDRQKAFSDAVRDDPEKSAALSKEYAEFNTKQLEKIGVLVKEHPKEPAIVAGVIALIERRMSLEEEIVESLLSHHLNNPTMGQLCYALRYSLKDKAAEKLLQTVAAKHQNAEARGLATYTLGLRHRFGAREGQLDPLAESFFEEVAKTYAEIKTPDGHHKLGDLAASELTRIKNIPNLKVGKVAPEIAGEDIDGKRFKLSDYRGKVVVLDFWGHW